MQATQRSIFQGIMYYYRDKRILCRYQMQMKDEVEPALLQQALDQVRPLAGYFFQKIVWEKSKAHLEPNSAPCPVRLTLQQPLMPEETNDYLFAFSCQGRILNFDWFHFIADGRGVSPFVTLVLQLYCNLRYGTAFDCPALPDVPAYEIEDVLARCPESQVKNDMKREGLEICNGLPAYALVRIDKASLVEAALRSGAKPVSALLAGLAQATSAYLSRQTVNYGYSADARPIVGAQGASYNCVTSFQQPITLGPDSDFAALTAQIDTELRENITPERMLHRMAEQMGWVYQVYSQKAPLKIQRRVFQMGEYISGFPADFWISYLGNPFMPSSPELESYVDDFQTWVPGDGASIGLEVVSLHGVITLCIENKAERPGYAQAIADAFAAQGVCVLECVSTLEKPELLVNPPW